MRWCESILDGPGAELIAVVLNSGGANACTGPDGYADTVATAEHLGALLVSRRRHGWRSRRPG